MSYQVLARKWRPKTFKQLMGQEHVVNVLVNALEQQRIHHAYLFTGTRGVGKTTIARIFAKSLNCEEGITSSPCGQCDTCQDIDQGRFIDLLEIDAASRTKVDDTREILDNVQYAPTRGRYKVYLIDEVHMLSKSSFNALLKTLEEPPEHVKFILATTDPQKLPVTVLSRCLQFHLKALTVSQIEQQLAIILAAEDVSYDVGTLTLLAKAARGSMRDSLSLTDQSIAQGQGTLTLANIQQMLGGIDQNWIYKILIALIKHDAKQLMTLSLDISSYAPNYSRLMAELIQLLHQIAMVQIVPRHFDLSPEHNELLMQFSKAMSPEDVQLYYQIVLNGRKDLPYAADEQAAFDMLLLRLLAFKPIVNSAEITQDDATVVINNEVSFNEDLLPSTQVSVQSEVQTVVQVNPIDNPSQIADKDFKEAQLSQEMADIEAAAMEQGRFSETINVPVDESELANAQELSAQEAVEITQHLNDIDSDADPSIQIQQAPSVEVTLPPEPNATNQPEAAMAVSTEQSAIQSVLATRNMLRSRKKAQEDSEKKPSDAMTRHDSAADEESANNSEIEKKAHTDLPALESIPEKPFTPDVIDPAKITKANQVDRWANMIDSMALSGRLRQLAIHASICDTSTDDVLVLQLDQSTKHLKTDVAHTQLQQQISQFLSRNIVVELNIVEQTEADPYQIQSHINDKRFEYARDLLNEDPIIIALQNDFQAQLDEKTIVAR